MIKVSQGQGEFFTFPVISIMMEKNRPVCLLFGDGTVNKESERNSTMAQNPIVTFETTQGTIEAEILNFLTEILLSLFKILYIFSVLFVLCKDFQNSHCVIEL